MPIDKAEGSAIKPGLNYLEIEADKMQTSYRSHTAQLIRLCCEGSILLFFILGLVLTVALGARLLEVLF